jgi:septal ring factor EnvC (AmiA/AmiB activator)
MIMGDAATTADSADSAMTTNMLANIRTAAAVADVNVVDARIAKAIAEVEAAEARAATAAAEVKAARVKLELRIAEKRAARSQAATAIDNSMTIHSGATIDRGMTTHGLTISGTATRRSTIS